MRAAVRGPGNKVKNRAKGNITKFSPGETPLHRTYTGRIVSQGFAGRSVRMIVKLSRDGTSAVAIIGVKAEAWYAAQLFELGAAHIPRSPWLVPALEASRGQAVQDVGEALKKRLLAVAKKTAAITKGLGR